MKLIGVDIGGSHITAAQVNRENLELIAGTYQRDKIDADENAFVIIKAWAKVIKRCADGEKDLQIGIAMPGPFDYENGISLMKNQGKYDNLYQLDVKAMLAEELQLATKQIKFNNDAACFLQGEIFNVGKIAVNSVGVTLGTGLGSAFIRNGKSYDADLWNTPFKESIMEEYISSRWFVAEFYARTGKPIKDVKQLVEEHAGEAITRDLFKDFADNLSQFLSYFIKLKDAECVVLGGNIAKANAFFLADVKQALLKDLGKEIPLYLSALGEEAALIGGASLFR
ncbi:MAG TPA: ROK family protein [Pelobium sp.]